LQRKSFCRKYVNTTSVTTITLDHEQLTETSVQCVRHSDPRNTAKDVSNRWCCDHWSAVYMVRAIQYDRLLQLINAVGSHTVL